MNNISKGIKPNLFNNQLTNKSHILSCGKTTPTNNRISTILLRNSLFCYLLLATSLSGPNRNSSYKQEPHRRCPEIKKSVSKLEPQSKRCHKRSSYCNVSRFKSLNSSIKKIYESNI